jgi:hypothetical protein
MTPPNHLVPSRQRIPATVWILTALFALMAFVSTVGSFIFAFPLGGTLGPIVGTILIAIGVGYAIIGWRLRRGERALWIAGLVLPLVHTVGLNTLDLVRTGRIPIEDLPFMGVTLVIVVLLLLPTTRRFFSR